MPEQANSKIACFRCSHDWRVQVTTNIYNWGIRLRGKRTTGTNGLYYTFIYV